MRNDLGQGSEYVKSITVGGNDMGGECHPDGGDYDCTFSNSCPALKTTVVASVAGTASVSMVFTGHSHDCDCKLEDAQINTPDYDNNVCVRENTGDSTYTPMKAAARFTATPVAPTTVTQLVYLAGTAGNSVDETITGTLKSLVAGTSYDITVEVSTYLLTIKFLLPFFIPYLRVLH